MSGLAESVGWEPAEGEHHTRGLLRMLAISRVGCYGHEATVAEARRRFKVRAGGGGGGRTKSVSPWLLIKSI